MRKQATTTKAKSKPMSERNRGGRRVMGSLRMRLAGPMAAAFMVLGILAPTASATALYQRTGLILPAGQFLPQGMAVDQSSGDLYVAGSFFTERMHKFAAGTEQESVFAANNNYFATAVDPVTGNIYARPRFPRRIETYDQSGNLVGSPFSVPNATTGQMAADSEGNLYTSNSYYTVNEQQQVKVKATAGTYSLAFEGQSTEASGTGDTSEATGTGDLSTATGAGDLSTATGAGDLSAANGIGQIYEGSKVLTDVTAESGAYAVGQEISGYGIPAGSTIVAIPSSTELEMSEPATAWGFQWLAAGSKTVTNVSTATGAFSVGMAISGTGIPAGATITAIPSSSELVLSAAVTQAGSGIELSAASPIVTNVSTATGAFSVGMAISGTGIPAGATITAIPSSSELVLSAPVTEAGSGVELSAASPIVTNVSTATGAFHTGQAIAGTGIPAGATITAIPSSSELELSAPVTEAGTGVALSASQENLFVNVNAASGTFTAGEEISGANIPAGTTITAVPSPTELELSAPVTEPGEGVPLTANLAFDSGPATIQAALEALPAIGAGNVSVSQPSETARTYVVTFVGTLSATNVPQMTADGSGLTGTVAIETLAQGAVFPAGVQEYSPSGQLLQAFDCSSCPGGNFTNAGLEAVAFDQAGNLYAADAANHRVVEFHASGGNPTDYTSVTPTVFPTGAIYGFAVDGKTGDFFVGGNDGSGYRVTGYEPSGSQFTEFGLGLLLNEFSSYNTDQLAVNETTGTVYVGDLANNFRPMIWKFAETQPPSAETEPATVEASRNATLSASVNPNGTTVLSCHFEYGETEAYGEKAPCDPDPGFGEEPVSTGALISGLQPNTTYHYRIVASNEAGSVEGEDEEFTTLIDPPSATTGAASAIAQGTATISGSVNPLGNPVEACRFEYGTTSAYGKQAACPTNPGSGTSPVAESLALSSLLPNTTYHYRIVAVNAGGTTNGVDATFTTLPKLPAVNTGAASSVAPDGAKLAGTVNAEGSPTSYRFEYGTTTAYGKSSAAGKASGTETKAVSTVLTGLIPATTYHYRLVATNAGGTSNGADQTFTTSARPIGQVEIPATAPVKHGKAQVSLTCKGLDIAVCEGTLTLRARLKQGIRFILVKIGQADFQIAGGQTELVSVPLNGNGRKALAEAEGKPLKAVVSAGGANRQLRLFAKHRKRHG